MDFQNHFTDSWEKVTKKIVDPITFCCTPNVAFVPRIEDCSYETNCFAISHPRFCNEKGSKSRRRSSSKSSLSRSKSKNQEAQPPMEDTTWTPMDFTTGTPIRENKKTVFKSLESNNAGIPSMFASAPMASPPTRRRGSKKKSSLKNSPTSTKPKSLGTFFSKSTAEKMQEIDSMSISSRSMNSRSVADRSHSERSKSEEYLAKKAKQRRAGNNGSSAKNTAGATRYLKRRDSKESLGMQSIDELIIFDFEKPEIEPAGILGAFLQNAEPEDDGDELVADHRSVMSGSTMGSKSISALSKAELSRHEKRLKGKPKDCPFGGLSTFLENSTQSFPEQDTKQEQEAKEEEKSLTLEDVGPVEKKFRFKEGHEEREIPRLTDSMYDDVFYTSEELADFRYEAFLEEAGLDVDEYMNM